MSEHEVPHIEIDEPFEWSERELALLRQAHRRELIVCAIVASLTSAVVTTVLFFGHMWLFSGTVGAS